MEIMLFDEDTSHITLFLVHRTLPPHPWSITKRSQREDHEKTVHTTVKATHIFPYWPNDASSLREMLDISRTKMRTICRTANCTIVSITTGSVAAQCTLALSHVRRIERNLAKWWRKWGNRRIPRSTQVMQMTPEETSTVVLGGFLVSLMFLAHIHLREMKSRVNPTTYLNRMYLINFLTPSLHPSLCRPHCLRPSASVAKTYPR